MYISLETFSLLELITRDFFFTPEYIEISATRPRVNNSITRPFQPLNFLYIQEWRVKFSPKAEFFLGGVFFPAEGGTSRHFISMNWLTDKLTDKLTDRRLETFWDLVYHFDFFLGRKNSGPKTTTLGGVGVHFWYPLLEILLHIFLFFRSYFCFLGGS